MGGGGNTEGGALPVLVHCLPGGAERYNMQASTVWGNMCGPRAILNVIDVWSMLGKGRLCVTSANLADAMVTVRVDFHVLGEFFFFAAFLGSVLTFFLATPIIGQGVPGGNDLLTRHVCMQCV